MKNVEKNKKRIYEIVEASHENDYASKAYDIMIFVAVIVGLIPLCMKKESFYTKAIDIATVSIFIIDYICRVYTADYKMGIKCYKSYLAYAFSPMAIIDLLSIVPIFTFAIPGSKLIPLFRLFRIFRMLKLVRYSKTMVMLENVLRRVKGQLFAVLILTFSYIMGSAMVIFQVEPDLFNNIFDAIYWATISITTIGYGDISPVTTAGRTITMISALVGVAVIALPSGIITAAYMDEMKKKKGKHEL